MPMYLGLSGKVQKWISLNSNCLNVVSVEFMRKFLACHEGCSNAAKWVQYSMDMLCLNAPIVEQHFQEA